MAKEKYTADLPKQPKRPKPVLFEGGPTWSKFWEAFSGVTMNGAEFYDPIPQSRRIARTAPEIGSPDYRERECFEAMCKKLTIDPNHKIGNKTIAALWRSAVREWEHQKDSSDRETENLRRRNLQVTDHSPFDMGWFKRLQNAFEHEMDFQKIKTMVDAVNRGDEDSFRDAYKKAGHMEMESFTRQMEDNPAYAHEVVGVLLALQEQGLRPQVGQELNSIAEQMERKSYNPLFFSAWVQRSDWASSSVDAVAKVLRAIDLLMQVEGFDEKFKAHFKEALRHELEEPRSGFKNALRRYIRVKDAHAGLEMEDILERVLPGYKLPKKENKEPSVRSAQTSVATEKPVIPTIPPRKEAETKAWKDVEEYHQEIQRSPAVAAPAPVDNAAENRARAIEKIEGVIENPSLLKKDPAYLSDIVGSRGNIDVALVEHARQVFARKLNEPAYLKKIGSEITLLKGQSLIRDVMLMDPEIQRTLNQLEKRFCLIELDKLMDKELKGALMACLTKYDPETYLQPLPSKEIQAFVVDANFAGNAKAFDKMVENSLVCAMLFKDVVASRKEAVRAAAPPPPRESLKEKFGKTKVAAKIQSFTAKRASKKEPSVEESEVPTAGRRSSSPVRKG